MINLDDNILQVIGKHIVVANNAAFLWRKLADSSTVRFLSSFESTENMLNSLNEILQKNDIDEREQTLVYCLAVAILLKNRSMAGIISTFPNTDKYLWLNPLTIFAKQDTSNKTISKLNQGPILSSAESISNSEIHLIKFPESNQP